MRESKGSVLPISSGRKRRKLAQEVFWFELAASHPGNALLEETISMLGAQVKGTMVEKTVPRVGTQRRHPCPRGQSNVVLLQRARQVGALSAANDSAVEPPVRGSRKLREGWNNLVQDFLIARA